MSKLFLSSYFSESAGLFPDFAGTDLAGKKVIFIPTAALNEKLTFYVDADRKALQKLGLNIEELEISKASGRTIEDSIHNADYIFVAGGNTFFLLQELRRTGTDDLIIEHIRKGKTYVGSSAGSAIMSRDIGYLRFMDPPEAAPGLKDDFSALSMVDFYIVPHHDSFFFKRSAERTLKEYQDKLDLRPISDDQVITVSDGTTKTLTVQGKRKQIKP
jgi:dipeptidase E